MIRRPALVLALLAVFAQLALPGLHAGGFAAKGGGLAFAICGGSGSDALLAQLREVAPADLLAELGLDEETAPDCGLCLTSVALAAPPLFLPSPASAAARHRIGQPLAARQAYRASARVRAPPSLQAIV